MASEGPPSVPQRTDLPKTMDDLKAWRCSECGQAVATTTMEVIETMRTPTSHRAAKMLAYGIDLGYPHTTEKPVVREYTFNLPERPRVQRGALMSVPQQPVERLTALADAIDGVLGDDDSIDWAAELRDIATEVVPALVAERLRDLLLEATRQDFGAPGWRERVRKALNHDA